MDDDKYIPTEEERKKFGRVSAGYSPKDSSKSSKSTKKYDLKQCLRDLTFITAKLSNTMSQKKFSKLWYECWKFDNNRPQDAINNIKSSLNKFNESDEKKILEVVNAIERKINAV